MPTKLYYYSGFDKGESTEAKDISFEELLNQKDFVIYLCIPKKDNNVLYEALRKAEPWKKETFCALTPFIVNQGHRSDGMPRVWVEFIYVNSNKMLDYREYSLYGNLIKPTSKHYGRSLEHVSRKYVVLDPYEELVAELNDFGYDTSEIEIPTNEACLEMK